MAKKTALASAIQKPIDPEVWVAEKTKAVPTEKPARLVVELPAELHRRLKGQCGVEGLKIKDVIHELLEGYLAGKSNSA
jgi:hypothetical protein